MILVISSPSISTTGFATLIFAILRSHLVSADTGNSQRTDGKFSADNLPCDGTMRNRHAGLADDAKNQSRREGRRCRPD
jgi:hypothetical protein